MIGYLNGSADIFIGNPDMPRPKYVVAAILDGNNGITLSDSIPVHTESDEAIPCIVVFYISKQIRSVLPYKFGFGRSSISVPAYVRVGDCSAGMVDEITQNIASGIACLIGRLVG